jgi:hypothetical protein
MRVKVTFETKVEYKDTPRCKKVHTGVVENELEVEVKELSYDEFPAAMIVYTKQSMVQGAKTVKDFEYAHPEEKTLCEEIRVYDGQFYRAAYVKHGSLYSSLQEEPVPYISRELTRWMAGSYYPCIAKDELSEKLIVNSDYEKRKDELLGYAGKYIISDGAAWEKCGEPIYQLYRFRDHTGSRYFLSIIFSDDAAEKINNESWFNADGRDMAISKAESEGYKCSKYIPNIDVFMPELLTPYRTEKEIRLEDGSTLIVPKKIILDADTDKKVKAIRYDTWDCIKEYLSALGIRRPEETSDDEPAYELVMGMEMVLYNYLEKKGIRFLRKDNI